MAIYFSAELKFPTSTAFDKGVKTHFETNLGTSASEASRTIRVPDANTYDFVKALIQKGVNVDTVITGTGEKASKFILDA